MRSTAPAKLLVAAGTLTGAYLLPGIAAAPGGRRVFRTVRNLDGLPAPGPGRVALTFDDGPEPKAVEAFLEALAELNVTATFFLVGEQVRRAPDAARMIVAAGHEVACHGYRHKNHLRLSPQATVRDLTDARDVIVSETGAEIRHFRPPYGVFNLASWLTAERLGWNRVLWAQWGRDWEPDATPERIRQRLLSGVADRDVLLLHDAEAYSSAGSWRRTLAALEPIVSELRARGLEPGPLGDIPPTVPGAHRAAR
ncbi:MAG TPA: polysaccharide deacetylase family protein [Actinomycetota bacterium]|nr:polysaccharide deacetylase family protein [Actinomycetota bacterium]